MAILLTFTTVHSRLVIIKHEGPYTLGSFAQRRLGR